MIGSNETHVVSYNHTLRFQLDKERQIHLKAMLATEAEQPTFVMKPAKSHSSVVPMPPYNFRGSYTDLNGGISGNRVKGLVVCRLFWHVNMLKLWRVAVEMLES